MQILYVENKALKDLAKLPLNDEMARQVAKKRASNGKVEEEET